MAATVTPDLVPWISDSRISGGVCACPLLFEGSPSAGNWFGDSSMVASRRFAPSTGYTLCSWPCRLNRVARSVAPPGSHTTVPATKNSDGPRHAASSTGGRRTSGDHLARQSAICNLQFAICNVRAVPVSAFCILHCAFPSCPRAGRKRPLMLGQNQLRGRSVPDIIPFWGDPWTRMITCSAMLR